MNTFAPEDSTANPTGSADPLLPVLPGAPWPLFRRDHRNSGFLPERGVYSGGDPWSFQTDKGVFSTPVIDQHGRIYIGSADRYFYVLEPDGSLAWKFQTGGIIDSAAALLAADHEAGLPPSVACLSGDGRMYRLRLETDGDDPLARLLWAFQAELRPEVSFNNWWEGNLAVGFDGTLYAGNTNFKYYAVTPGGQERWSYATGSNSWSMAAFGEDGSLYWGSNDTFIHAVSPEGRRRWRRRTLGLIAASAAVGLDGTVYIGSFDSYFYALDPTSGRVRWKFPTGEHIYSSAALGEANGETHTIYFGSADGCLYALDPGGTPRWRFDAGAPIRSSPVIGLSEEGEEILYFGVGDGVLYAVNAAHGELRWAVDTTPDAPQLRDRNDLNGSPALGKDGIVIGGEHGQVWLIPYDYPLHHPEYPRIRHQQPLPRQYHGVLPLTPGATLLREFPEVLSPADILILRLVVREAGETVPARVCNNPIYCPPNALEVQLSPDYPFKVEHSADGRLIYILPDGLLPPDQEFRLEVRGRYYTGGLKIGNLTLGGRQAGQFESAFSFRTADTRENWFPLRALEQKVAAVELTRITAALPPMLPSLNQIGFDAIEWIVGTALVGPVDTDGRGSCILWAVDAQRDSAGMLEADPQGQVALALSGTYQGDAFMVSSQSFALPVTGIHVPFHHFELRGRLSPDLTVQPGAVLHASTPVLSIPNFGPKLVLAGLANDWFKRLLVFGTYQTAAYPDYCPANRAPEGVRVSELRFQPPSRFSAGWIEARLAYAPGAHFTRADHRAGLLVVDPVHIQSIPIDYYRYLRLTADPDGNIDMLRLELPRGLRLPKRFLVLVMLDVFPLHREFLFLP
jgi:outer membrane protein assembly factor BamB